MNSHLATHRRSVTAQGMPPHLPPSFARSKQTERQRTSRSAATVVQQRGRANSVQEPSMISAKLLHQAASAAAMAAPPLPSSKLPPVPRTCANLASSLPSSRRSSRADLAENWRMKRQTSQEREARTDSSAVSMSRSSSDNRRGSADSIADQRKKSERTILTAAPERKSSVDVEVLPPMRVSMDVGPIEVLPPLRFSMDPPVKGRSAWRFVLPSAPQSKESEKLEGEEEQHSDLPRWFDGSENEFIVSLGGASLDRPRSPSAGSSASSSLTDSSSLSSSGSPPLDRIGDVDAFSNSHSRSTSPAFGEPPAACSLKTDMGPFHFAMPMLSAAAPLPSELPMPAFLRTQKVASS